MKYTISKHSPWHIAGLLTILILFTEIMHADSFLYKSQPQTNWQCTLGSNAGQSANNPQSLSVKHNVGVQCSEASQKSN